MSIPFVRQLPTGKRVLQEIELFPAIEDLGREFIAKGGCYLSEILPSGKVRIAACLLINGQQVDIEEATEIPNGPELVVAINELIGSSVRHITETKH